MQGLAGARGAWMSRGPPLSEVTVKMSLKHRPSWPGGGVESLHRLPRVHRNVGCGIGHLVESPHVVMPLHHPEGVGEDTRAPVQPPEATESRSAGVPKLRDDHGTVANHLERLPTIDRGGREASHEADVLGVIVGRLDVGQAHRRGPHDSFGGAESVDVDDHCAGAPRPWIASRAAVEEKQVGSARGVRGSRSWGRQVHKGRQPSADVSDDCPRTWRRVGCCLVNGDEYRAAKGRAGRRRCPRRSGASSTMVDSIPVQLHQQAAWFCR